MLAALARPAHAQDDDDLNAGLIGKYTDSAGASFERVDSNLTFDWKDSAPDPRMSPGPFSVEWRGFLMSQGRGTYRLFIHAAGHVRLKLNGQLLLDAQSAAPAWHAATPVELPFDWHPIEITFHRTSEDAGLSLFWSGPQFDLEPISQRQWFHEPAETPDELFEHGHSLVRALRCAGCHPSVGDSPLSAPALTRLSGHVRSGWLVDWLSGLVDEAASSQLAASRRMPHFSFNRRDAEAVAAYLISSSTGDGADARATAKAEKRNATDEQKRLQAGEHLFLSVGCLACHQQGELGKPSLFDGGDLTHVAQKRPSQFFASWLANPATINADHRMPRFDLTDEERKQLAAWLTKEHSASPAPVEITLPTDADTIARGRKLVVDARCSACHKLSDDAPHAPAIALGPSANWSKSCLSERDERGMQPRYQLTADEIAAVRRFVQNARRPAADSSADQGRRMLVEHGCVQCHARGAEPGIAAMLPGVAELHRQLEPRLPALTPPSLNSVGDKLYESALEAVIRRQGVHRPYLEVRMPRFRLTDDELNQLVQHFVTADRIPDDAPAATSTAAVHDQRLVELAGPRLVTTDGFGCTSCHAVGGVDPPPGPLNARGPDLSQLGQRIRKPWFDRWVRNPARIVPRMEMPSVQLAVGGVLDDDVDAQLAAVWQVLNLPDFKPPAADPVRIARRAGIRERDERAVLATDVLRIGKERYIKPALVGLPNRHNALFDLETGRLDGWWIGDAARQRTEGKTWFWEAGAADLRQAGPASSELVLSDTSQRQLVPQVDGQFITELDGWQYRPRGAISLRYRLHVAHASSVHDPLPGAHASSVRAPTAIVPLEQTFTPLWPDSPDAPSGFRRQWTIGEIPADLAVQIYIGDDKVVLTDNGRLAHLAPDGAAEVRLVEPAEAKFAADNHGVFVQLSPGEATSGPIVLDYLSRLPVDRFPLEPPTIAPPPPVSLAVVPGFEAVRLPIVDELMPTGLAWRPNGEMVVASLKGRVWLARDTNGDGLEDHAAPFSDDLAAPYGVAATDEYVDAIGKYALLRLYDDDGDGVADRVETLASGWGHTADYHDWAVGLPADEQGGYFVSLACQQDKRSEAAAHLRGQVVRLEPRTPSVDDPRRFSIQPLSGGHRFAMGIARNRAGELFVTDNQGNYKPFNELNQVFPGARYGFINAIERTKGFQPPPRIPPSVNIPHPWTRSVNGICFLETPEPVRKQTGRDRFGPFEGHLIGCEYDTRRLIRLSLDRVGDSYQGAAYPFSYDKPAEGEPLLGPICCSVSPSGDLYIGSIRDSGWGGANNIGTIMRMRPRGDSLPPGIAEVRALRDGFEIAFTTEVDERMAREPGNYSLASYTRVATPAYGGSDVNRRKETIASVTVADDRRSVRLRLNELREGHVYEFHVKRLVNGEVEFFPDEAHYTLNHIPADAR